MRSESKTSPNCAMPHDHPRSIVWPPEDLGCLEGTPVAGCHVSTKTKISLSEEGSTKTNESAA
jgi:hypothetical protein